MDVVLISARGAGPEPHWSRRVVAATAAALAARGDHVRWLCPLRAHEAAPAAPAPAVVVMPVAGRVAPFRSVTGRSTDPALDVALARALRPRPADVVVHVGFGAPGSVIALWLADRMGSRVAAVVRAAEVLCHRGTLIDERGQSCRSFADAARCTACCSTAGPGALSAAGARCARLLRPLGALSPFPSPVRFQNRADLAFASLQLVEPVLVATASDRELLVSAGLDARSIEIAGPDGVTGECVAAAIAAAPVAAPARGNG